MKYRDYLQKLIYTLINPIIKGMIKMGITPNMVTTIGFVGNVVAAFLFIHASQLTPISIGFSWIGWGGAILLFSGLFDMMDGRLARLGNMSTTFGAFWDSTLDRYSELFSLFGITLYLMTASGIWAGVITFLALVGSIMVSYVRARAEGLGIECKVGLMQRPERVVVTALAAIITGMTSNLWWLIGGMTLIAVLANITAFWRVAHCYKQLKDR
ncbi:CDP-alcohol phosphatidyltransferase family protein [Hoylesella buccalis]|uniref:CDP-alcohol phosphatidyltransferase family protein n=1 Tax=Hoylesella buccalis TaxID=28127 RepID=UPI001D1406EA|nr:CDP-alcohol phosphatidyltransferase family protein [Hoylesella buccalis]UEA62877.1 CDP-alcohol phosphatidyltransferase family protein [Hoylesella buccalis]UWP49836.1 CDP-alcohol phosphatidyltransferase family protein [Hoylesella buccalis ATCC 35310]